MNYTIGDVIGVFIFSIVGDLYYIWFNLGTVRNCAGKKSYTKLKKHYPYFNYPWYKKLFFVGLKDACKISWLLCFWFSFYNILSVVIYVATLLLFCKIIPATPLIIYIIFNTTVGKFIAWFISLPIFRFIATGRIKIRFDYND